MQKDFYTDCHVFSLSVKHETSSGFLWSFCWLMNEWHLKWLPKVLLMLPSPVDLKQSKNVHTGRLFFYFLALPTYIAGWTGHPCFLPLQLLPSIMFANVGRGSELSSIPLYGWSICLWPGIIPLLGSRKMVFGTNCPRLGLRTWILSSPKALYYWCIVSEITSPEVNKAILQLCLMEPRLAKI